MKGCKWFAGFVSLSAEAAVLLFASSAVFADVVSVDLGLTPPGPLNQFGITVKATAFSITRSGSDTATVTGNILADLGIEFDPVTQEVTSVDELEFTGGTIYLSDVSLTLDYGWLGKVVASGTGISGTLDTPNPPGTVSQGKFNTAEHVVILNNGQFYAYGTGSIGNLFDPMTIDLSANPIEATTAMTGYLDAGLRTVVRETATYDVALTLPVNYDEVVYDDGSVVVTVAVAGTLESTAQFTRVVPYFGAVAPDVLTRLEEADPGATSFTRGAGDTELEWGLEALHVDGAAQVDDAFVDPDDPSNLHQFHVCKADTVVTSERIDVRDYAGVQVAVDLRSWDTSSGFESDDNVDLGVLVSYDGLSFDEELFWLEIEGKHITALDNGENGAFTTFGSQVGLIPDDVVSMRVVVDVVTNSLNEHVMWDNLVVSGIPVAEMSTLAWDGLGNGFWDSATQWTGGAEGQSPDHATHVVVPANTVTVDAGGAAYTLSIHGGGAVAVDAGETLAVGPSVEVADGTLDVRGTLSAWSVDLASAMLKVGSTGTLSVGSGFALDGGSEYACELGASDNGLITAAGDVHLDGTLSLRVIEPLETAGGRSRSIIETAKQNTIIGDFAAKPSPGDYLDYGVFYKGEAKTANAYDVLVFQASAGDADGDGDADPTDLSILVKNWDPTGTDKLWREGNFDDHEDGNVDPSDLSALVRNWAPAGYLPEGAAAVPEPGAMVLLGIGGLCLLGYAWRRRGGIR